MTKIFPYYKGKNIANNPLGYTTIANARKHMDDTEVKADFENTLPRDYWLDHYYVYELENPWSQKWMETVKEPRCGISTSGHWYGITTYTKGYIKHNSAKYLKELPKDVHQLFIRLYKIMPLVVADSHAHKDTYKEEYRDILYSILSKGYNPTLFKDEKDYKKKYKNFVTDNVEFREMEVDIVVR
jgi:hypothetical protein